MSKRGEERDALKEVLRVAQESLHLLRKIFQFLYSIVHAPTRIHIRFSGASMPATFVVGQTIVATPVETDAAGATVVIADLSAIAWTTSDAAIASFVAVGDGTATYTAVAAGTVTVSVTDPANGLTTTDTLTVTAVIPPVAMAIAIEWGTAK
jgi:hypothetical protein